MAAKFFVGRYKPYGIWNWGRNPKESKLKLEEGSGVDIAIEMYQISVQFID